MDKLVRKIEIPLAMDAIRKAGLYVVPKERFGELSAVAAQAYRDYPLHMWFAGGKYNAAASARIMSASIGSMAKDALVYADSEEINGFAVWMPMGFTGGKALPFLVSGGAGLLVQCGPVIIKRLLDYETFAMKLKKKYTGNVDWYLYNLSVAPKAQGKGIASKLMRPMLEFCDRERMVCYLETNKKENVSLYEHFGFYLAEEELLPKSNVAHYAMVRGVEDI